MNHLGCKSKLRSVMKLSMLLCPRNWVVVRSCIMTGLPTHLVQELNDSTVDVWIIRGLPPWMHGLLYCPVSPLHNGWNWTSLFYNFIVPIVYTDYSHCAYTG